MCVSARCTSPLISFQFFFPLPRPQILVVKLRKYRLNIEEVTVLLFNVILWNAAMVAFLHCTFSLVCKGDLINGERTDENMVDSSERLDKREHSALERIGLIWKYLLSSFVLSIKLVVILQVCWAQYREFHSPHNSNNLSWSSKYFLIASIKNRDVVKENNTAQNWALLLSLSSSNCFNKTLKKRVLVIDLSYHYVLTRASDSALKN